MAALALLVCVFAPLGVKAAEGDVHDMNITQSTNLNNSASIPSIEIATQSYSVKTVTINWRYNKAIENPVTIEVLVGETSWGTQTITGNTTADAVFEGESTIGAIVINFTNNTGSGTGHGTFYVNSVKLTEGVGNGQQPTTYTVTFDAGDGSFVGNTDFPNASNTKEAGTYSLPNATREGYTMLWSDGEDTFEASANYEVTEDVDFTAQWTENVIPTPQGGTDVLTNGNTIGESTSNYAEWTTTVFNSGASYKGYSAGSNNTIQLRSNNSNSGIVTTTSGGKVTKVVVTWGSGTTNGRTLNVYGKNTAYSAATDLYNSSSQGTLLGTIVCGTSTTLTISGDYNYIGMRSNSGAMYLDEIEITWGNASSLSAPAIRPAQLTFVDSQEISITAPEGAAVRYTLDGSEPTATTGTLYTEPFTISNTTTVKAIAYTETAISEVTTATYTRVYTITLNQTTGGTISGPAQAAAGATVTLTATPNVGYTFGTWSVTPPVTLDGDSFTMPASNVTVSANFTASTSSCTVSFSVNNKVEMTATTFGGSIDLTKFVAEAQGYQFNGWSETATGSVIANPTSYTPQADITLYAQFGEIVSSGYTLVTNVDQLVDGNLVVIAAHGTTETAMGMQDDNNRPEVTITKNNNNTITWESGVEVSELTLGTVTSGNDTYWTFYDPEYSDGTNMGGYLFAVDITGKNYLRTQHTNDANGYWTISISSDNDATITANGENTGDRKLERNSSAHVFSTYKGTQQPVYIYTKPASNSAKGNRDDVPATSKVTDITDDVLVTVKNGGIVYLTGSNAGNESNLIVEDGGQLVASANVKGTMLKSITGYGSTTTASNYYFISTPLTQSTNPQNVKNMINANGYDLYYFDQNPDDQLEWRNYKAGNGFNLFVGSGYLYANSESVDLEFAGNLRPSATSTDYDKTIKFEGTQTFAGWNLVGNPFTTNAIVNKPFYALNSDANGIQTTPVAENSIIAPMEGVFVLAAEGETDQKVTFTATTEAVSAQGSKGIVLEVNRNNKMLDRAIVDINQGGMLSKLRLSEGVTELYIPQGNKDYAIVRSDSEGEMPVSFRASENGTYTLSFSAENTEMRYMHLIDNMTGNDIDLLQTPSYSFEAKTTDYANRFRIVFNANNGVEEMNEDQFAFFNGSEWVVNSEGEATLQVIDMMGRVVSSQTVNGNANVNINEAKGVYVIRLTSGNNTKTQKVVVK